MPDAALHGNGYNCPGCELRRAEQIARGGFGPAPACNQCKGTGRIALRTKDIVAAAVAEARLHYWPERDARWGTQ
jgi:hypothetical protein